MKLHTPALEALRDIALAAGDDWGRPLLAQLRIAAVKGGLALDATDSFIWVHRQILADVEEEAVGTTLLVPARTIRGIALACIRDGGTVEMDLSAKGLAFWWQNAGTTGSNVAVGAYESQVGFPKEEWKRRPAEPIENAILAPALLTRAARALGADVAGHPGIGVHLSFADLPKPIKMTLARATTDYAWIMPQRPPGN